MKPSLWLVSIALAVASPLAAQEPKLRTTLSGHAGAIVCLAFSADGKTLASAGADGAELWDLATGKTTFRFSQRLGQDYAAAFSPDGKTMVSGGDFSLRLWDVATGKSVRLDEDTGVLSVALSADGKTLVSGSGGDEHNVKLWDMSARRRSSILDDEALHCVALSADGRTVASGSELGNIKLWNAATGKNTATLAWEGWITAVAFSPDGKTLAAVGTCLGAVRLWDVPSGKATVTLKADSCPPDVLAFSPDGKTLAVGYHDKAIRFWDVKTGSTTATFKAHAARITALAFGPDGKTLAAGSRNGTIKLWDVKEPEPKGAAANETRVRLILRQQSDGAIVFQAWDLATQQAIAAVAAEGKRPLAGWSAYRGPQSLRDTLGGDRLDRIVEAHVNSDETARQLAALPHVEMLVLTEKVTDAGLANLKGLTGLKRIHSCGPALTDAALRHISAAVALQYLHIQSGHPLNFSDEGLGGLQRVTKLKRLEIGGRGDRISDRGLEYLAGLKQLQVLYLPGKRITDVGLAHLRGLRQLQRLSLPGGRLPMPA